MTNIEKLLDIMTALRDPERGCPWDQQQTFESIAAYTVEEAYEVADAIGRQDLPALQDELGDLLLQVVFHAEMARELEAFDFDAVAGSIVAKMLRRHPHVFGDESVADAEEQRAAWEMHKARERTNAGQGALAGVGTALPALLRAQKIGTRAASVGFDWPDLAGVRAKIDEELAEIDRACATGSGGEIAEEIGDLLFTVVNLARHVGVDAEQALRSATEKFRRRFDAAEQAVVARGEALANMSPAELDAEWQAAKDAEKGA